ncbi:Arp7p [Lachancea thermotolerans CBS 6340]|uniref:KLTH0C05324p n=1 Tax=Lachancea thermotolerans (strain ATCC 56472 / CBS 6340 / NRRL Y-8284) TaxID=559295 RepID=C5DE07_LACTC|nr:KLTH0C05324p [Lachancea thermotolerans CBS 6340]CAR22018.1 KLTH0C05324p [Lachancea thermotolerans CBS 6340]
MSVVIHNGTHTTVAGFSNVDMPQIVCSSSYVQRQDGSLEFVVEGMLIGEDGPVYTMMDAQGVPYNWDALEKQWRWICEERLGCRLEETPVVATVAPDLPDAVRAQYLEMALGRLKIPVFQLVVEPLAVALSLGRNTALVVDVGAAKSTVTPIIDGTVVQTAVARSKFAGDFLDMQVNELLTKIAPIKDEEEGDPNNRKDPSLTLWRNSRTWIQEFKTYMLQVAPSRLQDLDSAALDMMGLTYIKNFLLQKQKTISLTQKQCCELAEGLFQPRSVSQQFVAAEGLSEIVAKSVKKAGASTATSSSATNVTTPEQTHAALLTNILITGSSSLISGLEQRIVNDLSYQFPQYKLSSFANPLVLDRKLQSWQGGVTMANLPSWDLGDWVSQSDYEARNERGSN